VGGVQLELKKNNLYNGPVGPDALHMLTIWQLHPWYQPFP